MHTQEAYNNWSGSYDSVTNKTRDLEAEAIRSVLNNIYVPAILEIGCGTGKNTGWLAEHTDHITAVDFSRQMLEVAKEKLKARHIDFLEADITKPWGFQKVNLITCSLVLEHIRDLAFIFGQAAAVLKPGGRFYICELHPYRQLTGSRAKFEKDGSLHELEYFVHHISEYCNEAKAAGFALDTLNEWFDNDNDNPLPRLVSFLFTKPK
jgi:ubiquinone/menaquinone biosynthesis C-methylase UbiE